MNNSNISTNTIRNDLYRIVHLNIGITENTCGFDSYLCEIPLDNEDFLKILKIKNIFEKDGLIDIQWELNYSESYEEAGDAWTFKYITVIDLNSIQYE